MRFLIGCVLLLAVSLAADEGGASFHLGEPGQTIKCKWIAYHNGGIRYMDLSGRLTSIDADQMKYVSKIEGKVYDKTPAIDEVKHTMHCSGGVCKSGGSETIVRELWPTK